MYQVPNVPIGIVMEGRPAITEARPIDSTKAIAEVAYPGTIAEVVFFLLPTTPIPPGFGAALYFSIPPFSQWEYLGAIEPSNPSAILRTGWMTDEAIKQCPVVQLGVSIESLDAINNLKVVGSKEGDRKHFALQVARDLFRYIASFSKTQGSGSEELLIAPANILDRWIARFESKYARDPNFVLKTAD
mmetsp:Transcript_20055/g.29650  ORF Transcript_20055/g.29650 Transcript_20055/m.29650 type:complete len:188 (+) Transcript_20055:191-754(+)|eukprot:CAMPEP_0171453502 /NCGR_PEP_ID=MMETSP0945-20130129/1185_1 /TAXON_ID=109269 /ORGANISM="Vaucheria litorea, Strain CCMP2940" /LENGTH=187 /DNA_ID=CAMNT_0011978383 /DNA_START=183 /DNA_END=746 /DNA_ORIENTATION=-